MKRNSLQFLILLSCSLLVFGCAKTKLVDYQPKTTKEGELVEFMSGCSMAYHEGDLERYIACFDDSATIRIYTGGDIVQSVHPMVSKKKYEEYLDDGGFAMMNYETVNPKFTFEGNKSTMECDQITDGGGLIQAQYNMVRENNEWKITYYRWTFRGR